MGKGLLRAVGHRVPPRLIALVVASLVLAQASNGIVFEGDDPSIPTYQTWIDDAHMPTPAVQVSVLGSTDLCRGLDACTRPGYVYLGPGATRDEVLHEMGHQFDYTIMTDAARAAFMKIMRLHGLWRSEYGNPPNEKFAEAYRMCAKNPLAPDEHLQGYLYDPTVRQHRRVCALIRRTAAESPLTER